MTSASRVSINVGEQVNFDVSGRRRLKKLLTVHLVRSVGDETGNHGRSKDVSSWTAFCHRYPGRIICTTICLLIFYRQLGKKLYLYISPSVPLSVYLFVCLSLLLLFILAVSPVSLVCLSIHVSRCQSLYVPVCCNQDTVISFLNFFFVSFFSCVLRSTVVSVLRAQWRYK